MYLTRLIEKTIEKKLNSSGAIVVLGPKFCGKTTTCKLFSKSSIELIDNEIIDIVLSDPKNALIGDKPRLIDEWQNVPELWNYIRRQVDIDNKFSEFILTGSATPPNNQKIHHSGAGRITPINMRTMSLYETKDSSGIISLKELFDNNNYNFLELNENYNLEKTAYYICRGGWPTSVKAKKEIAIDVTRNYYEGLFNFKNSENIKYKNKNSQILKQVLKSYARNISTEASYQTILKDVTSKQNRVIDIKTFNSYLEIAEDLFIIEDIEAWTPNLRSKTSIRTTNTRHFVDTSIACCVLNITPELLMKNATTFGFLFEDFAVHELKVYCDYLGGEVRHYRDSNNLECDAIIHLNDDRWAAIEIKLGGEKGVEEGAANLNKLENIIADSNLKPTFKMILTATGRAYKRKDGIYVVPINLLGI